MLHNGRPATTSLEVAKFFGKRHDNVVRDIKEIIDNTPESFSALNFEGANYIDEQAKNRPMYIIYRDGFMLLVMGYTGKKALVIKLAYIEAFNHMEAEIATSLKNLRTDHIELFQFHNPSLDGLKTILAPGGAMEALLEAKARGIVGHIGITAHLAAVFEAALDIPEIETIMFPYNIVEQQGRELIDRCAAAGKGFIDMKPLAGGAIEDGRLALRYVLSNPAVTVSIPGMATVEELNANVAGAANTAPLTPEEEAACQKVRDALGTQFCRRCNYCAPCTVGISIPSVFLFQGYLNRYGLQQWGRERYATLQTKAGACIRCGACEPRCPYDLPIRQMMQKAAEDFGE